MLADNCTKAARVKKNQATAPAVRAARERDGTKETIRAAHGRLAHRNDGGYGHVIETSGQPHMKAATAASIGTGRQPHMCVGHMAWALAAEEHRSP